MTFRVTAYSRAGCPLGSVSTDAVSSVAARASALARFPGAGYLLEGRGQDFYYSVPEAELCLQEHRVGSVVAPEGRA